LSRGRTGAALPEGARHIKADLADEAGVAAALKGLRFDVIAQFITFTPDQAARDIRLFEGLCGQFIFISSASAYEKPPKRIPIDESTPLRNPFWSYSRDKIACELLYMEAFREKGFPLTVIRPSHTYGKAKGISVFGHGDNTEVARALRGAPLIVHGDGTGLWTVTHGADFARGFAGLCGLHEAVGEAFHITSGEALPWIDILRLKCAAAGVEPEIRTIPSSVLARFDKDLGDGLLGDKSHCLLFDQAKLKRFVPDFAPSIRFADGIAEHVEHMRSRPELAAGDLGTSALMDRIIASWDRYCAGLPGT
jgi:nucleoside-diphosphate-sugar epimerase